MLELVYKWVHVPHVLNCGQVWRRFRESLISYGCFRILCKLGCPPLLCSELLRTIALLLGVLRDFIVGLLKTSSASAESRRQIFGRPNFHPRVVSLGINVSSKVGHDGRRTGEGTEQCCLGERSPRHYNLGFSTSNSSVYTDVFNLAILPLDNFPKKKE